jgi:flagellar motility protein MotE (MotC chaperone)
VDEQPPALTGENNQKNSLKLASAETNSQADKDEGSEIQSSTDTPEQESENLYAYPSGDFELSPVRQELANDLVRQRERLEAMEQELMQKEALLQAAEKELDRKYQELVSLRKEIEALLEKQSQEEQERIASLVKIYEGMKAKDAANIFNTLDVDILVEVMSRMSERKSAPILASMNPERARTVTILLAEQKKLPTIPPR